MPPAEFRLSAKPLSGRYLFLTEREEIALLLVQGCGVREIRRNAATRIGNFEYRATTGHTKVHVNEPWYDPSL